MVVPQDSFLLRSLAQFRYQLRQFLLLSEQAAQSEGLHPQQHQLLLQVAGCAPGTPVTITYVAERLGLRHNSAVELVDRSVEEGLILRQVDPEDGRRTLLTPKRKGRQLLEKLSAYHARELNERGPELIAALTAIRLHATNPSPVAESRQSTTTLRAQK